MAGTASQAVASILPAAAAAGLNIPLVDLGLDSIAVIRIVRALERDCRIAIPREEITYPNFATLAAIEALVARLR